MDPFAALGLPRDLDLDPAALERRYIELMREHHPDRHRGGDPAAQAAIAERAAMLNDAYRILRDPWRRAESLLESLDAGVIDRHKQLSPAFLAAALALAEEVAAATPADAPALRARLQSVVDADFAAIRRAVAARDFAAAATRLHEARYHRKALADLAP